MRLDFCVKATTETRERRVFGCVHYLTYISRTTNDTVNEQGWDSIHSQTYGNGEIQIIQREGVRHSLFIEGKSQGSSRSGAMTTELTRNRTCILQLNR